MIFVYYRYRYGKVSDLISNSQSAEAKNQGGSTLEEPNQGDGPIQAQGEWFIPYEDWSINYEIVHLISVSTHTALYQDRSLTRLFLVQCAGLRE